MASFLERFKGKINLVSKDGVIPSLDKPSLPIKKQVEPINNPKSASLNPNPNKIPLSQSQKTILPQSAAVKVENSSSRSRKVKSFSTCQPVKARKLLALIPETVVRTETDILPNSRSHPASLDPKTQKSAPVSTRNSPAGFKEKPKFGSYYQPKLMTAVKSGKKKNLTIEEIQETEELEEIQRGHFNYLSKVEKMHGLK